MDRSDRPVIGFLTDFGVDGAAATCRGVMLGICPDAQIIDISHGVAKYAIADGSFLLRSALPYFPVGVHVAVVDPGVGTHRRPIGLRAGRGDVLIGPDNGLLVEAAEALGGIEEARELSNRSLWLPATSSTFHGRDIFAPVAAHLAAGDAAFEEVGDTVATDTLEQLERPPAVVRAGAIQAFVVYVDSFGNLRLSAGDVEAEAAFGRMEPGTELRATVGETTMPVQWAPSFGHVPRGGTLLYRDSSGNLALARNQASLAADLGVASGASVKLSRHD